MLNGTDWLTCSDGMGTGIVRAALLSLGVAGGIMYAPIAQAQKAPDLGKNVLIIGPHSDLAATQARILEIYKEQQHSQFGSGRYALLFEPGSYKLDIPVGYYTEVDGLGRSPEDVRILGNVHADAAARNNNATSTFWRGIENVRLEPPSPAPMQWAVSQAVFLRRVHIAGDLTLHQQHGWASGGWLSDSIVDGTVDSGSQQQWISRNAAWSSWTGSNWNMVFVGVKNAPAGDFPKPPFTRIATTPVIREKPFLCIRGGVYGVFVPRMRRDSVGVGWTKDGEAGKFLSLASFYIAKPGDTAATMNRALRAGKNLLLTPGLYDVPEPVRVTRKDTIVLGMGFPTLRSTSGNTALAVDDVDGVTIAGLLVDAGATQSPTLVEVGKSGLHNRHAADPIVLQDIFFRIGGAAPGKDLVSLAVHSDDTLIDHTWIWRADHGTGVGWADNTSDTGLLVDGDHVTAYGLFVEHHEKYQVIWNGEAGRMYFYQCELPYEVPSQEAWTSGPGVNGWAAYKVGDSVKQHEAWGLGIYSVFRGAAVKQSHAVEVPDTPGVRIHHVTTVSLVDRGEITHLVNDAGQATIAGPPRVDRTLTEYPVAAKP